MKGFPAVALVSFLLLLSNQKSFVGTSPLESRKDSKDVPNYNPELDEVKQLEDLKESLGPSFSIVKTQSSVAKEVNGEKERHSNVKEQVKVNGQVVGSLEQHMDSDGNATPATHVKTELDIPSKGIHKVTEEEVPSHEEQSVTRRAMNDIDSNMILKYSPVDMAEYVFWTGDEKGVTMAIEEFLQEGLMTREEAISFLQEIKSNLEYLQSRYAQQNLHKQEELDSKERASNLQKALGLDKLDFGEKGLNLPVLKKSSFSGSSLLNKDSTSDEYEDILERFNAADVLTTEYSLEEIVYQLAKVMFSQSLKRGSSEAQTALQKFTNFLETESQHGRISHNLEKKVLNILIAALTDTLAEHPDLVPAARKGLGNFPGVTSDNMVLQQLSPAEESSNIAAGEKLRKIEEEESARMPLESQQAPLLKFQSNSFKIGSSPGKISQ